MIYNIQKMRFRERVLCDADHLDIKGVHRSCSQIGRINVDGLVKIRLICGALNTYNLTMRKFVRSIIFIALLFITIHSNAQFTYISPVPGSKMNNQQTNIILRTGELVDATSLRSDLVTVSGSLSGTHAASIKLAIDRKTILVTPSTLLSGGETVTVKVKDGIKNVDGSVVNGTSFQFQTHPEYSSQEQEMLHNAWKKIKIDEYGEDGFNSMFENNQGTGNKLVCDHMPSFTIVSTPGAYYDAPVFYRNQRVIDPECSYITISSSSGDSIYGVYDDNRGIDFKINDNGYLTYYDYVDSCFDMIDSSYNLAKQFFMGNGYTADEHEFRVFPDGTSWLLCYDLQILDMTAYGGVVDAQVTGLVIQELDANGDVIFQWSSWDHFQITDTDDNINLTIGVVDLVHGNSLDLDDDGNLLLSSRHLDEITKIDISTGDIMWRLGGKNNQFTFIDEIGNPKPFSFQHHFRRIGNGVYSMFDNGNNQSIERATAKEYSIDEVNKTATLIWYYYHPQVGNKEVKSVAMGSLELLPNGNRFIDWGLRAFTNLEDIPNFTEVDSLGNIVWEFWFADSNFVSYRAFKSPWDRCNLIADSSLIADSITFTSVHLHWGDNAKISDFALQYKKCTETNWITIATDTGYYDLEGLEINTCHDWRIKTWCDVYSDSSYTAAHQFNTHDPAGISVPIITFGSLSLYPNPATGQTEMRFTSAQSSNAELIIYNILGAIVRHQSIAAHEGLNNVSIDLASFSAGTYTVELKADGQSIRRKLVVH